MCITFYRERSRGREVPDRRKAPGFPLYEVLATRAQSARWGAKRPGYY